MNPEEFIIDSPAVSSLLFSPSYHQVSHPFWVQSEGARLCCHYEERVKDGPVIVFFHGNGETAGSYAQQFPNIMEIIGCNIFLAEYRGYGDSEGKPNLRNFLLDAEAIASAVPCSPDKMILFGRSLGCLQAIHAASICPGLRGLILEGGIANVGDWVADRLFQFGRLSTRLVPDAMMFRSVDRERVRHEANALCSHQAKLTHYKGRSLVVSAAYDRNTGSAESRLLYDWLTGPKVLKVFDDGDHNSVFFENTFDYCDLISDLAGKGDRWM